MPLRPLIGVICCTRTVNVEPAQAVMNRYVAALRDTDAAVVLIPVLPDLQSADEIAARIDGLFLTGTPSNLQPSLYGDSVEGVGPFDPARDAMTSALIGKTLERERPVFGVCRGFQEINVAFGGSLRRDLGRSPDTFDHHAPEDASFEAMFDHRHPVDLTPGGVLAKAYGADRLEVNSAHFQGVARVGAGLDVEARASDGIIEAVSTRVGRARVLGVQWHPEWRPDLNPESRTLFRLFGEALRE